MAKVRAYPDIETTGLSREWCEMTVVGIGVERNRKIQLRQLVGEEITRRRISRALSGVDVIYTYNGKRFDLPFIEAHLGLDLEERFFHRDLMFDCWKQKLKGGLKVVERKLKIKRRFLHINGFMAVKLWWAYINDNDRWALEALLEYNKEDVVNLRALRRKLGVS